MFALFIMIEMGISERKEREREEMRALILEAAKHLFLEHGYAKTSIRGIADRIEYSPATIYLYYKDKKELMLALQVEAFGKMNASFGELLAIADPFARLQRMGELYISFALENPQLYDLMFMLEAPMEALECQQDSWLNGMQSFDFLKQSIWDCVEAGYFEESADIDALALTVWSYMHGLVSLYLKGRMVIFGEDSQLDRLRESQRNFIDLLSKK
ncbi:AcrR family transcriptional regulator [Dyadobacter jejuensis]|uniref:AcrR family transcriptional regulator n=1 Tax=Dyadobacter jejuensis TaxID=1082580 RepID=A0A316ARC3_9BACT|nr:TetR/AcrR family transcriptional regulator [Dyadobacter jejuensis]PWJ60273.1 AcrR family transcriptional regulator [Dyadobacter jejuensis]